MPLGVVLDGPGHRAAGHREHVGRRGEKGQGDVVVTALVDHTLCQGVDGGGHAQVRLSVGIDVVAEDEPSVLLGHPLGHRAEVMDQVTAEPLLDRSAARPCRDRHRTSQPPRVSDQPLPQLLSRQVDRHHVRAPPQEGPQRSHLGSRTEHDDGLVRQVEPVRVGHDALDRLGARRLDDSPVDPPGQHATERVPGSALSGIRHRDGAVWGTLTADRLGDQRRGTAWSAVASGPSPDGPTQRIRSWSEASPSRAMVCAASGWESPASTRRRKCGR